MVPSEYVLRFNAITVDARKKPERTFSGRVILTRKVIKQSLGELRYCLIRIAVEMPAELCGVPHIPADFEHFNLPDLFTRPAMPTFH